MKSDVIIFLTLVVGLLSSVGYLVGFRPDDFLPAGLGGGGGGGDFAVGSGVRVYTKEELKKYDGSDEALPMLLCVLGEVFDVTSGAKHYGKGSGYNVFLAQDSSKAFHTGEFNTPVEDVRDLNMMAVQDVTGWRSFYRKHESYHFAGVLEGLYYDAAGKPTAALVEVNALESKAQGATEYEEQIQKKLPTCAMAYSGESKMTTITCDRNEQGLQRQPRILTWTHSGTEKEVSRCVCLSSVEIHDGPTFPTARLNEYEGCEPYKPVCIKKFL